MNLKKVTMSLALAAAFAQTACNKPEAAGMAPAAAPPAKLLETPRSDATTFAWATGSTVSRRRQIEVGDHPGILLERFEIGARAQRVRFLMADDENVKKFVSGSPQDLLFLEDSKVAKAENDKWSPMALVIESPANLGLAKFSDGSTYNGLAVSPQLLLCAASALQNVKAAGATRARVFQNWQINEVNILIKPVQHASEAESKMAIDSKLHALNFQISAWTRSGDCFLPSETEIGEALDIADQRVEN